MYKKYYLASTIIFTIFLLNINLNEAVAEENWVFGNPVNYQYADENKALETQLDQAIEPEWYTEIEPEQNTIEEKVYTQQVIPEQAKSKRKHIRKIKYKQQYEQQNQPQQNFSNYPVSDYNAIYKQSKGLKIPAGTSVTVYNSQEINADNLEKGQNIEFTVDNPVIIDGITVIQAGTRVSAQVLNKKNNFIFGIPGEIQVGNFKIHNVGNKQIDMMGSITEKGDSRYWAHIGWLIVWPLLMVKGGDGIIPAGQRYTIHTIGDTYLNTNTYPVYYNQY